MVPKKAIQTVLYSFSVGIVAYASAIFSNGLYIKKVIPLSMAIIFAGLTSALSILQKGKKIDQECDEREKHISLQAMKFTFFAMSFVITAIWAYEVAILGTYQTSITIVLYAFWGSYLLAYGVNKFKF